MIQKNNYVKASNSQLEDSQYQKNQGNLKRLERIRKIVNFFKVLEKIWIFVYFFIIILRFGFY